MTGERFKRKNRISLYEKPTKNLKGDTVMKTLKNKLYAITLLACGYVPVLIDNDGTALVFFGMIAIPLFFAKENWII